MNEHENRDELLIPADEEIAAAAGGTPPMAIIGAVAAGLVGAAVWAGITLGANMEIGWIAWGIGAAVGAAYFKLGGRSASGPVLCAAIAVASIGAGKYIAFQASVSNEIEAMFDSEVLRMQYDACKEFGTEYAALSTDEERDDAAREWLAEEGQPPAEVSARDLEEFRADALPMILAIARGEKSLEEFEAEFHELIMAEVSFADALGGFDLLWIALGVMTAWRLASGTPG